MKKENLKELTELLAIEWNNSEQMIKHCLKSSKYVKIGDKFIEVCNSKPTVTKTLYYNDEYEAPEVNFEMFLLYNEKNMPTEYKIEGRTWGGNIENLTIIPQYHGDKTNFRLCGLNYGKVADLEGIEVSLELFGAINEAIREVQEDFKKRLKAYWNRYSDNITACGYWANR